MGLCETCDRYIPFICKKIVNPMSSNKHCFFRYPYHKHKCKYFLPKQGKVS